MAWKSDSFGSLRSAEFWALQAELKDLKASAGKAGLLAASKLEHVRALHCEAEAAAEAASDQLCQEETAHAATRKKLVRSRTLSMDCEDSVSRGCSCTCFNSSPSLRLTIRRTTVLEPSGFSDLSQCKDVDKLLPSTMT